MSMVDISDKPEVYRQATATGAIVLRRETVRLIKQGKIAKGDPFHTAKVAAILGAKRTSTLIPLCHLIALKSVKVEIQAIGSNIVKVSSTVTAKAQTGVEMEALVSTSIGLLTIWDMVKQYEKDVEGQYPSTVIETVRVENKIKESGSNEQKHKRA